ncbi:hypothetical protein [Sutcliffiella halmapala]|uniref:hypothetical protein n=1 Tax=Sutcliffiella halmapala TaxID=79882 RepID=UPI0009958049|nr:hypothetical protein [Sutcliffiella halmapala]
MSRRKQNQIVFYTIRASTIKKFIVIDCVTGTGIYYAIKIISASTLIGLVGTIIGIECIKRISVRGHPKLG